MLVEALIAVTVIATLAATIGALIAVTQSNQLSSSRRNTASGFAAEAFAAVRAIADGDDATSQGYNRIWCPPVGTIATCGGKGSGNPYQITTSGGRWGLATGAETIAVGGVNYNRSVVIDNVSRDGSGDIEAVYSGANDDPATQKVTVTITAPQMSNFVVSEYVTRSRNVASTQTDWVSGVDASPTTPVTAFGKTYYAPATNIVNGTAGQITLTGGAPYAATGSLDSLILDTQTSNGAGLNALQWQGTLPTLGSVTYELNNYAYNPQTGLIGFNCELIPPGDCAGASGQWAVTVDDTTGIYSGWAWSDTVGWISFNCAGDSGCNPATEDYKVSEPVGSGVKNVTGWAWSDNIGWVAMACDSVGISQCGVNWDNGAGGDGTPSNDSVWVDAGGSYRGWAWSDTVGWISFDCMGLASPYDCLSNSNYRVVRSAAGGSTRVRIWIASSNNVAGPWDFLGAGTCLSGGTAYEPQPGVPVQVGCFTQHWNKRYFRYRVELCSSPDCSSAGTLTPTVQDVTVNWSR